MVIQHFNIKLGGEKLKNLNIAMGLGKFDFLRSLQSSREPPERNLQFMRHG